MRSMSSIRFSDFELRSEARQLIRDGTPVPLGARAFDLLALLVRHRDRVVPRREIMKSIWQGMLVGDNNLNVQVANLRRILGPKAIVTVPGRGLRFALEVTTEDGAALPLPDRPSVAVLPFSNFGGDPDLDWMADGFVEDITTELSRFRDLFVVARNSAFVYRDMPRDLRLVGRDLGVRYVVEGSVRATAQQVRVTAQLIDAATGGHVWAESFDRDVAQHFTTQAQVARAIAGSLAPQIDRAEGQRTRAMAPENLTARGLAQRAWAVISAGDMAYDRGPRDRAADLAEQALAVDPDLGLAWRVLAWVHWWHAYHATTPSVPQTLRDGIHAANKAIAADPTDHHPRRLRGLLHFMNQAPEAGLAELRLAHDMNPNCAVSLAWLGLYEGFYGDVSRGVPLAKAALRRSPRDPARASLLTVLGFAQFTVHNYSEAVTAAEAALSEAVGSASPLILLTIAQVGAGRIDAARRSFETVQALAPTLVLSRLNGRWLASNPDYIERADLFFQVAAGQVPAQEARALLDKAQEFRTF